MPLNKVKPGSNMYPFLNDYPHKEANRGYTINFVKGQCEFACDYCYYQNNPRYKPKIGELRLDEKEFKTNLGQDNFIFVGSSIDMWADSIDSEWIEKTLDYCRIFDNQYLFQTKNPKRFAEFENKFPEKTILGITLETNRPTLEISKAPLPMTRVADFCRLNIGRTMLSLEPIMDFDFDVFLTSIQLIRPEFVSIGANSKSNLCSLPEPSPNKIQQLINELKIFTDVRIKDNLHRLYNQKPKIYK